MVTFFNGEITLDSLIHELLHRQQHELMPVPIDQEITTALQLLYEIHHQHPPLLLIGQM